MAARTLSPDVLVGRLVHWHVESRRKHSVENQSEPQREYAQRPEGDYGHPAHGESEKGGNDPELKFPPVLRCDTTLGSHQFHSGCSTLLRILDIGVSQEDVLEVFR